MSVTAFDAQNLLVMPVYSVVRSQISDGSLIFGTGPNIPVVFLDVNGDGSSPFLNSIIGFKKAKKKTSKGGLLFR